MADPPVPSDADQVRRHALKQGGIFLVVRVGQQIVQLAMTFLLARLLMPEDYGVMTTAMLLIELADLFVDAGISKALVQKKELTRADILQGFTLSVALAAVLYLALFMAAPAAAEFHEVGDFPFFLRCLGVLLLFTPFRAVCGALLERDLRFARNSLIFAAGNLLQGVLTLYLAWRGHGYWSLAIGALTGRAVETMLAFWWVRFPVRLTWPGAETRELLRFGLHVSAASLLWYAYTNSAFAVVGLVLGTVELGNFFMAYQLATMPAQKIMPILSPVLFASFSRMRDQPGKLADAYLRLLVLIEAVVMPALLGLMVVAPDLVPWLLTEKWTQLVLPLQLLCPVGIVIIIGNTMTPTLSALGRPDIVLRYTIVCVMLLPAGFVLAGWCFGVAGVCGVWLGVFPVIVAGLVQRSSGLTGITLGRLAWSLWPAAAASTIMALGVCLVRFFLAGSSATVSVLVSIGAGVAIYGPLLMLTNRRVLEDVRRIVRELRS